MFLSIDTTSDLPRLTLYDTFKKQIDCMEWTSVKNDTEKLLPNIEELFKKNNRSCKNLAGIVVARTGKSYTGIRVGLTTANFLAFGFNIGIFPDIVSAKHQNFTGFLLPEYSFPPKITEKTRLV